MTMTKVGESFMEKVIVLWAKGVGPVLANVQSVNETGEKLPGLWLVNFETMGHFEKITGNSLVYISHL